MTMALVFITNAIHDAHDACWMLPPSCHYIYVLYKVNLYLIGLPSMSVVPPSAKAGSFLAEFTDKSQNM